MIKHEGQRDPAKSRISAFEELRVVHIGLAVKDAEATSEFLSSMWGIGPWAIFNKPYSMEQMILGEPFVLKIAFPELGTTTLELIQPGESPK